MVVVVIVLAVVALALLVVTLTTGGRLTAQRKSTAAAEERATTVEAGRAEAEARASEMERRAETAAAERDEARSEAETAAAERDEARHEAETAEAERDEARREAEAAAAAGELDAQVVWALEQARTERTWRQSVAVDPEGEFPRSSDTLHDALQVELEAAREDVGAYVELDVELPDGVTPAGALLALRAAQELLAVVMRRSDSTTVQIRSDGADLLVDVHAVDDAGAPIEPGPLPTPPSPTFETTTTGVRIRNAVTL